MAEDKCNQYLLDSDTKYGLFILHYFICPKTVESLLINNPVYTEGSEWLE